MPKIRSTRLLRTDRLGLSYLYGAVVAYRAGETLGPRVISDYEFVLIIEGHVTYICNGREHAVPPGGVVLSRPGFHEMYRWDPHGPTRHAYFHFQVEHLPRDLPAPRHWAITQPTPDPVIPALIRHIVHRVYTHPDWPAQPPGPDDTRLVEALLGAYLRQLPAEVGHQEQARPEPVRMAIHKMRMVLDEDPGRDLALPDLAAAANVTEKHLCRLFRRTLGHPPMQTFNMMRMQLGLSLVCRSNLTIKEIADRCGVASPYYFTRCFTKTYGQSPSHIRARIAAGQRPPPSPLPADVTPRLHW